MTARPCSIVTGRYETAAPEQRGIVRQIFGDERTEEKYRLYFYWYNVVHELGHAILCLLSGRIECGPDEELLVNRFAVAFWSRCGEPAKLRALAEIVREILPRFRRSAPEDMDFLSYARAHWGTDALYNFNNYGWFQFSCVRSCLTHPRALEDVLAEMGVAPRHPLTGPILKAGVEGPESAPANLRAAIGRLREWGVDLPEISHRFSDDLNEHCFIS